MFDQTFAAPSAPVTRIGTAPAKQVAISESMPVDDRWLSDNYHLRLDGNHAIFPQSRRAFHLSRYEFAKTFCAGKRVLDAACGTGYGTAAISDTALETTGIDFDQKTIDYASQNYSRRNVSFQKSTIELTPFDSDSFDTVVSFETLEHTISPESAVREFARLLKPDGTAVLSIPNAWGLTPHHFYDFDLTMLKTLTETFFGEQEYFYNNSGDKADRTPYGIGPLGEIAPERAECILAVCRRPRKERLEGDRQVHLLEEIYQHASKRHNELLEAQSKRFGPLPDLAKSIHALPQIKAGRPLALDAEGVGDKPGRVILRMEADEKPGQTLQATALVHEAYMRLVEAPARGEREQPEPPQYDSRSHFFAAAGEAMRRILVERARAKKRTKHGGGLNRLDVDAVKPADDSQPELVIAIHDVLDVLAEEDERLAQLVKLRCFVGFSLPEAADALGIGQSTAYEHWAYAKSRLRGHARLAAAERLEDRTLLTVTSVFDADTGVLTYTSGEASDQINAVPSYPGVDSDDILQVVVNAGDGDDSILVYRTPTVVNGGKGDDDILPHADAGSLTVVGGEGTDRIFVLGAHTGTAGGAPAFTSAMVTIGAKSLSWSVTNQFGMIDKGGVGQFSGVESIVVSGTEAKDTINGRDAVVALSVDGFGGDDTITGGSGDDDIDGGKGADSLVGGDGRDTIHGGDGDDSIMGGGGNDVLRGGDGANNIAGGADDDLIQAWSVTIDSDGEHIDVMPDSVDGGSGNDRVTWLVGSPFDSLSGGTGEFDLLTISGLAGSVNIDGSAAGLNTTVDGDQALATGWEAVRMVLTDNSLPEVPDGVNRFVTVNNPVGVGFLSIRTQNGNDTITVNAADFSTGTAIVDIQSGYGDDTVTLVGPKKVGELLEVEIDTEEGKDNITLYETDPSLSPPAIAPGPTIVEVKAGDGNDDTLKIVASGADKDVFVTQIESFPGAPNDEIAPGKYLPEFEQLADDLAAANPPVEVRAFDKAFIHTGNSLVAIDMDPGDEPEHLEISTGTGDANIFGNLKSFEGGVTLQSLKITGGDGDNALDISGISTTAVPGTIEVKGNGGADLLKGRGAMNFLDGGDGFDICVAAGDDANHSNCESFNVSVTAEFDENASASVFGTYIHDVTLENRFEIEFNDASSEQVDLISEVIVTIEGLPSEVSVEPMRQEGSNIWTFTVDMGLIKPKPGGVTNRSITIEHEFEGMRSTLFSGSVRVTDELDLHVKARPLDQSGNGVGSFVNIEDLRMVETGAGIPGVGPGTRLEYQVVVSNLPFTADGVYSNKLQLIAENRNPNSQGALRHSPFENLSFMGTTAEFKKTFEFSDVVAGSGTGGDRDLELFLSPRETDILSPLKLTGEIDANQSLDGADILAVAVPEWLGQLGSTPVTFVTTQDGTDDADAFKEAFGEDGVGGYIIDARIDLIEQILGQFDSLAFNESTDFFTSVILPDQLATIPTVEELSADLRLYVKLTTNPNDVVLEADAFDATFDFLGKGEVDTQDEEVDQPPIDVNIEPKLLDLKDSSIAITSPEISIATDISLFEISGDTGNLPNLPFSALPWLTVDVNGSLAIVLDDVSMQMGIEVKYLGNGNWQLVPGVAGGTDGTYLNFTTTASATGTVGLEAGLSLFGLVDLFNANLNASLTGRAVADITVLFSEGQGGGITAMFDADNSDASTTFEWSFSGGVTTIVDEIDAQLSRLNSVVTSTAEEAQKKADDINLLLQNKNDLLSSGSSTLDAVGSESWIFYEDPGTIPGVDPDPPGLPDFANPFELTDDLTPRFSWNPVSGASAYDVLVYDVSRGQEVFRRFGTAGTSVEPTSSLSETEHQVFVRAVNSAGFSQWQGPMVFTVVSNGASGPVAPRVLGPGLSSNTYLPQFSWTAVAGAENYELLIYDVSLGREVVHETGLTTNSFTPNQPLNKARHQMFVRATGSTGTGAWSAPQLVDILVGVNDLPPSPRFDSRYEPAVVSSVATGPPCDRLEREAGDLLAAFSKLEPTRYSTMNDLRNRAREIFLAGVNAQTARERSSLIDRECRNNEALRTAVEKLFEAHDSNEDFLEGPLDGVLGNPDEPTVTAQVPTSQKLVTESQIGPYKLLQQIGEGGFGVVYMAEQMEPVRRRVALKIIKPGMDSREIMARFEAERQALAMMDHPNVSKVLDAGTTTTGRPYFVMDLVRGVPLTEFCDENQLSTRDRLKLFVDICMAVQHAHQKGIIHRDLKPSNVLVTINDDVPMPKVIDFGISKAINQQLTDMTLFTAYGQIVGTPLYMSPEQAQFNSTDVDTRSDVYSLGTILYELLTGNTPFDRTELNQSGFDEMRRLIREVDPPRPSARVSTLNAQALKTVSDHRKADTRKLSQSLRGELDWIVMKALDKKRTRRYESASAFAADIERYLNDEAVEACPPSMAYRLRKYARRHKGLLTTAALLAAVLITSTIVSATFAVQADRAREESEESAQNATQAQVEAETQAGLATAASTRADRAAEKARNAQQEEARERLRTEAALYVSDTRLSTAKVESGAHAVGLDLLLNHFPKAGQRDLRGWEWYHLLDQANQTELTWQAGATRVSAIAWSSDGKRLATAHHDAPGARIWDAQTGRLLRSFSQGNSIKYGVDWSPDGRQLAWGCATSNVFLRIWDAKTNKVVELPVKSGSMRTVKWSPDGNRIAATSIRVSNLPGKIMIWSRKDGGWKLTSARGSEAGPDCGVDWNHDGSMIAYAGGDVRVINPQTTKTIYRFKRSQYWIDCDWSPNKKLLAVVGGPECVILNVEKQAVHKRFQTGPVRDVDWSPDGRYLATSGLDGYVKIWKTDDWSLVVAFAGHNGAVSCVAWHPDSSKIASCGYDGRISIWPIRPDSGKPLVRKIEWNQRFAWTGNGLIQTYLKGSGVVELHPVTGTIVRRHQLHSPNGWTYLAENLLWRPHTNMGEKRRYEFVNIASQVRADREMRKLRKVFGNRDGASYVYTTHRDHSFVDPILVDAQTGAETKLGKGWLAVLGCERSPDGKTVAVFGHGYRDEDGFVAFLGWLHLFDAQTGRPLKRARVGIDRFPATSCTWSPDGRRIAAGTDDGFCDVLDARTLVKQTSRRVHAGRTTSLSWHPTEDRIASGSRDRTIAIWNATTGEVLIRFKLDKEVHQVAWSPNGKMLAAKLRGGELRVWNAAGGYKLARSPQFARRFNDGLETRFRTMLVAGDLENARRAGLELLERRKKNPYWAYHNSALLTLSHGDAERYLQICRRMVDQFKRSDVPVELELTAWTCALIPKAVDDYTTPIALAKAAVAKNKTSPVSAHETHGAILYRAGRFQEALNVLQEATASKAAKTPAIFARYFLALTQHRLGRTKQAATTLATANRLADTVLNDPTRSPSWNRRFLLALFRKEAEKQIGTSPPK
eukprot:g33078.t1